MGCCSPAPRGIVIETTVLRVDGDTCERCGDTIQTVRQAPRELQLELLPLNVGVTLVEHATIPEDDVEASNSVMIDGRPKEDWLGAQRTSPDCPSCGELLGESTGCPAVSIGGTLYESITAEQIRDAALAALGIVDVGGC